MNGHIIRAPLGLDPHSKVNPQPFMRGNFDRLTKSARNAAAEKRARKAQRAARKRQRKG